MPDFTKHKGSGHGWVYPRPDGVKARCGGPAICTACAEDQRALDAAGEFAQGTLDSQYTDPTSVLALMLEAMKGQLLIVLVNRLGGKIDIPVAEIDGTGQFMLGVEVDQTTGVFTFTASKKS